MADAPVCVYLHGFASGPSSAKAAAFARWFAARGLPLHVPDLNDGPGGFEGLTVSRALAQATAILDREGATERGAVVIGSSLGGYLAALLAARDPRARRAVLLAPAFDLVARFTVRMGEGGMARWRADRAIEVDHHATGRKERLGYGFYLDALGHRPWPSPRCPTLVVHGKADAEVPYGLSVRFAESERAVTLVGLDADHGMVAETGRILAETAQFLDGVLPAR